MKFPVKLIKKNPFVLAPMDDVTDIAFRELCEEEGASYSTCELTSVDALVRDKVILSRFQRGKLHHNAVQLFGSKPEFFIEAAKKVRSEADSIDVNFGCPSSCVNANDSGAILLKDPKNVGKIIEKLVKHQDLPVTAKIRLGYKSTTYNEVAKEIEDAGAQVLAVHGRTAAQKYSGLANWDAIKEIYDKASLPIVGNGDISNVKQIDEYLGSYCDALMIGRAAIGNPYIFKEFNDYYKKRKEIIVSKENKKKQQKELFARYLEKLSCYEIFRVQRRIQRQAMWFMKGIEGAKDLRLRLQSLKSKEEILKVVEEF